MSLFGFGPVHADGPFLQPEFEGSKDETVFKELISQRERRTASTVNIREIATYDLVELINGQQWFNPTNSPTGSFQVKRYAFRQVYQVPPITAGSSASIPSNIVIPAGGKLTVTRMYGVVLDSNGNFDPVPYSSNTPSANIEFFLNASLNIRIFVGAAFGANVVSGVVILEYLKN